MAPKQLRRECAPQTFAWFGAVDAAIVAGTFERVAYRCGQDRAHRVAATDFQQAVQIGQGQIRPRGIVHQHEIVGAYAFGQGQHTSQHRGCTRRAPRQVSTGLDCTAVQPGQSASSGAIATTMPASAGCAASAISVYAIKGWPPACRYCLGSGPPKRVPRPAAGTIAQMEPAQIEPVMGGPPDRWRQAPAVRGPPFQAMQVPATAHLRPRDRTFRPA